MPELPEVETVVRGLAATLPGRRITDVDLRRPDVVATGGEGFAEALRGRAVAAVVRRGKNILIDLPPRADTIPPASTLPVCERLWLRINLGMTGRLYLAPTPPPNPWPPHTHLGLTLDNARQVHFRDPRRFGGVWLLTGDDPTTHPGLCQLGPEPLTVSADDFITRVRASQRAIKNVLLDQSVIAGVGNIYADESLHRAALHPLRAARTLSPSEVLRLWNALREVLANAIAAGGSTIRDYISADGSAGLFQIQHAVYGRQGQPCRTCTTATPSTIQRLVLANRSAHYCPVCQPLNGHRRLALKTRPVGVAVRRANNP